MNGDEILGVKDLLTKKVKVPEWGKGEVVWVRTLSGLLAETVKGNEEDNFLGRFAALVLCSEQGEQLFKATESDLANDPKATYSTEAATELGGKFHIVLQRICDDAQKLNGIGEEAQEELAKN